MSNTIIAINHRQMAWLVGSLITGGGLLTMQHELVRIGRMDAWYAYILPLFYVVFFAYVLAGLAKRFPGMHLFEITQKLFGRPVGLLVNLVLIAHLWLILMRDLRAYGKFISTMLLPSTPEEILVLLLVLLLLFYGRSSVEVVARVNDIFFPVLFIMIVSLPLLLSNELDLKHLLPQLTINPFYFLAENFLGFGWYGDVFIIAAFLHTLWTAPQIQASVRHGAIMATGLLSIFLVMEIVVMGPFVPGNLIYPNYGLVQHIHLTDFLDRVDLVMLSIWFPITICKFVLVYLSFLTGISSLLKKRDYTLINLPVSLFLLLTTLLAFKSTTEIFFFGNFSSPVIVLAYQPLLLLALLLFMQKHSPPREAPGSSGGPEAPDPDGGRPQQQRAPTRGGGQGRSRNPGARLRRRLAALKPGTWMLLSNILLLTAAGCCALGLLWGKDAASLGKAGSVGYASCLALAVLTSHMEMQTAKNSRPAGSRSHP